MLAIIVVAVISYLIGSINFSVLISKRVAGFDVRQKGSGNAGTTNMLRSVGKGAAAITLVCDILKGVVAVIIAFLIGLIAKNEAALLVQIAGIAVVIGHTFPVFFEFKGGKGVATALGVLICINWKVGLICLIFAIIMMAVTRMVSVGSCTAAVLYPILTLFGVQKDFFIVKEGSYLIFSLLLALLIIFNHRENIKRILAGKENKLSFKK
ncbi:MAG: glycerol-3-phosphate 1-O-acyltransferase PlsY [Clostridia bacterium]|nr:glycerol-3-phosphate 1-O-acyltransferase PlsY [Clostridia bacterium]MCI9275245.1 glycerol-3-phosphate 1-O-acyltransferase PlsY [Clostridia bacterium]